MSSHKYFAILWRHTACEFLTIHIFERYFDVRKVENIFTIVHVSFNFADKVAQEKFIFISD